MRLAQWHTILGVVAAAALATPAASQTASKFVSAEICSDCHSRLYATGNTPNWSDLAPVHHGAAAAPPDPGSIAPFALWSGSMMSRAAVDPYWRAKVRYEAGQTPSRAAEIENACLSCHAAAQQYERRGGRPMRLDDLAGQGLQGVSCTVCHQIAPDNLGQAGSFTAGFEINRKLEIYGPHKDPFPMPMRMHTGRTPTESPHVLDSALCGTCHTVITPTLDAEGRQTGRFLEQATYLEWLSSGYAATRKSCQSCHMPLLQDERGRPARQFIAHTPHGGYFGPTQPREPFGLHTFGGVNVRMLDLMTENGGSAEAVLSASSERAHGALQQAAQLLLTAVIEGPKVIAEAAVVNRAGHKLPSGFPSRRMWLRFRLTDASGEVVFESGGYDPRTGEILALSSRRGPAPHLDRIDSPEQVIVYEADMRDARRRGTVSLMRAAAWEKDNRILPLGFKADAKLPKGLEGLSVAPVGVEGDGNFRPGSDKVRFEVALGDAKAPYRARVELLYQALKPAHEKALDAAHSVEERRFLKLYAERRKPVSVASAEAKVSP